jgi:hypothetical protein
MKVVVNRCYGGFGLSKEALAWLRERGWKHCDWPADAPRHDPLLVACVEAFGDRASGECASLSIEDADSAYKIREHDGFEHVESAGFDAVTITDDVRASGTARTWEALRIRSFWPDDEPPPPPLRPPPEAPPPRPPKPPIIAAKPPPPKGPPPKRTGAWLLRVERQAEDALLERLPWGWSWIRLPWMEHPLQVEW